MDVDDLVERLCTAAGMIMEDVSTVAIVRDDDLPARVAAVAVAARDIGTMAAAASALLERYR